MSFFAKKFNQTPLSLLQSFTV